MHREKVPLVIAAGSVPQVQGAYVGASRGTEALRGRVSEFRYRVGDNRGHRFQWVHTDDVLWGAKT